MNNNLTLIVNETKDSWFIGQVAEIPEAMSQGKSLEELRKNIIDALKLALSIRKDEAKKEILKI